MCAEAYHEPVELIDEEARNYHRAIVSLIEELQAVELKEYLFTEGDLVQMEEEG